MHDNNSGFLLRTTNVKETFPNKEFSHSSNLTWEELQSLNAGEWFLKVRVELWHVPVHTLTHKHGCAIMLHATVTGNVVWFSRQILTVQCPSSRKRRWKPPEIRPFPPCSSSFTSPGSTTSQCYLTYIAPTRKMTQWTQSTPSWVLALSQAWYVWYI